MARRLPKVTLLSFAVLAVSSWIMMTQAAGIRNASTLRIPPLKTQTQPGQSDTNTKKQTNMAIRCSEGHKRFGDPNNEGKFYMCSYSSAHRIWMVYSFNCPAETVFDSRSQSCGKKSNINAHKKPYHTLATRFQARPKPNSANNALPTSRPSASGKNPLRTSPRPVPSRNRVTFTRPNPFRAPVPLTVPTTTTTSTTPTTTSTTTTTTTTTPTTTTTTTTPPTTTTTTTTLPPPTTTLKTTTSGPDEYSTELDTKSTEVGPSKHIGVIRKVASNIAYLAEVMEGLLTSLEGFMSECDEFVKEDYLDEILPNIFPGTSSEEKTKNKVKSSKIIPSSSSSSFQSSPPSAEVEDQEGSSSEDDLEILSSNELNKGESITGDIQSEGGMTAESAMGLKPSEWNIFLSTVKTSVPTTQSSTTDNGGNLPDDVAMNMALNNNNNMEPTTTDDSTTTIPTAAAGNQQIFTNGANPMGKLSTDSMFPALLTKGSTSGAGNRRPRIIPFEPLL